MLGELGGCPRTGMHNNFALVSPPHIYKLEIVSAAGATPMRRPLSVLVVLIAAALDRIALAQDGPFDPVGTWRSYHKDGTAFDLRLFPDGSARSTADLGHQSSDPRRPQGRKT